MTQETQLGISLRFIRQYDATVDRLPIRITDLAFVLAMQDPRTDVPFSERLRDALTFLSWRQTAEAK